MKIERYNYAAQFGDDLESLLDSIGTLLVGGQYILTDEVRTFETEFSKYLGAKYARGINSGTDALIVALMLLGLRPGEEVVTQANTFYATVAAIKLAGATPVLVDADEDSFLIDETRIEEAITSRTRVLMPVHLYGKPTPMRRILELANKYGLQVVEDAAQAHGARIEGRAVGTFGSVGCFSFHPSKNLAAAGDGGAIVTDSQELNDLAGPYRELGQRGQNNHVLLGLNSKLDGIQALILNRKLPHLEVWNQRRREVAEQYRERLGGLPLKWQSVNTDELHVYHLFQIRTERRDQLLAHLRSVGIDAVIRYPVPIHLQQAFADCGWRRGQYPVAERLAEQLLCLPIRPDMSVDEVDFVSEHVRSFFEGQ